MTEFPVEQALYRRVRAEPPVLQGRSAGFRAEWLPEAEQLLLAFGVRPPGVRCPSAVFAHPLGKRHVVIVQVADLDVLQNGYSDTLGYRLLVVPRREYTHFLGDPFVVAEQLAPDWAARGDLPSLNWPAQPLPARTVAQVRRILQRTKIAALVENQPVEDLPIQPASAEDSAGPVLLGGTQALVDGGRLVLERPGPDTELIRDLWVLLPTTTRAQLWPASFAFSNDLQFDVLVVPHVHPEHYPGYTTEEQAADYPESRYELALQMAVEQGDQQELDALFGRQSLRETVRFGLLLLFLMIVLVLTTRFLELAPPRPGPSPTRQKQAHIVAGLVGLRDPLLTWTSWHAVRDTLRTLEKQAQQE